MNLKDSLKATFAHAVEIIVSLALALAIVTGLRWLGVPLPADLLTAIGAVVINGFLKFQRTSVNGVLKDYVNGE